MVLFNNKRLCFLFYFFYFFIFLYFKFLTFEVFSYLCIETLLILTNKM